jgi:hypothetical protein
MDVEVNFGTFAKSMAMRCIRIALGLSSSAIKRDHGTIMV